MKGARTGARVRGLFCFALVFCFSITACTGLRDWPSREGPEESGFRLLKDDITRLRERTKSENPDSHLVRAQELAGRREYEAALQENKLALAASPYKPPADRALFNMVLIYSHPVNPKKDINEATGLLRLLQKDFPRSPWTEQARIWMETNKETDKLRREALRENDRLKKAVAEAQQENDRLKKAVAEAQQENQKLKRIVEQSSIVDIEIDEKKRSRGR